MFNYYNNIKIKCKKESHNSWAKLVESALYKLKAILIELMESYIKKLEAT